MNWQKIKCAILGHSWVVKGEHKGDIGAERNCICGAHEPAIEWPRFPMPPCKPSAPERIQVLSIASGDTLIITKEGQLNQEQRERIKASVQASIPEGCKVMVLEGGLKVSAVVTATNPDALLCEVKAFRNDLLQQREEALAREHIEVRAVDASEFKYNYADLG